MQTRPIPPATLNGVCALLQPHLPGLSPTGLFEALKHCKDSDKAPTPEPAMPMAKLAALAGVSPYTIRREITRGNLRAVRVGRQLRIPMDAARVYLGQEVV